MRAKFETVACNLCGSRRYRHIYRMPDVHYFRDEWFDIVECVDCGLGFVNPRPVPAAMDRYYPRAFFDTFVLGDTQHQQRYAREAAFLEAAPRPPDGAPPQLLDVGCANGDFPRFMRAQGWNVEGVEIAAEARSIDDFTVYRVPFPEAPVGDARYDAVTAWAVLEHVHDPMAYFRKAAQVLRPGGVFVFLVPNFASLSSRCLFREDVPRHLYFFTPSTIKAYLEKNGLVLERATFDGAIFEMRPVNWLRHYLRRLVGLPALRWTDLPEMWHEWHERTGAGRNLRSLVHYSFTHPLAALDRLLMPLFETWQRWNGTYGTATYVARKSAPRSTD